jgi:DNA-binding FadR family transcriptional regulator
MVEHFSRGERRPYAELDRALHNAIVEAADNKTLSESYKLLQGHCRRYFSLSADTATRSKPDSPEPP